MKCQLYCISIISARIRMFLGLPDLDPLVRGTDPDLSFCHKSVKRTEIMLANKNLSQNFRKKITFLRVKIMCLRVSYTKNLENNNFFASLYSPEERSRIRIRLSEVRIRGSGSRTKSHVSPTL